MIDLPFSLVSTAYAAQDAVATAASDMPPGGIGGELMRLMPLTLIFIVFYFLLIRPQQQRDKELEILRGGLQKGDRVLVGGGFLGTVVKIEGDKFVLVELTKGMSVKVLRSAIAGIAPDETKSADNDAIKH